MATVSLFDPRDPMEAGAAILDQMLDGQDVVADRESLSHAIYDAAQLVGESWEHLADRAASLLSGAGRRDNVLIDQVDELRGEVLRATEAAEQIFAAILSATPSI